MSNNSVFYYVNGDPLCGKWIDLEFISSTDDILEELAEGGFIPRDEDGQPNYGRDLLIADFEGELAHCFYQGHDCFDLDGFIEARDNTTNYDEDVIIAFIHLFGCWDQERCEESYLGQYDSPSDYAYSYCNETGILDGIPENLKGYFDFDKFGNDLMISDINESNNHYFYNW